jgi:hypothetical protein
MNDTANTLQIPTMFHQVAPHTPIDTPIYYNTTWTKLIYLPPQLIQTKEIPLVINLERCLPLQYPPQHCYYTNMSFKPPKETSSGQWNVKNMLRYISPFQRPKYHT